LKRINSILLVDDDRATNFYHSIIIRDMNICENVIQVKNGQEALDYVNECVSKETSLPDYIFIDRHMPILDGFEFIDKIDASDIEGKENMFVILLSTLLSEPDTELVKTYLNKNSVLKACRKKPLTEDLLIELAESQLHFKKA